MKRERVHTTNALVLKLLERDGCILAMNFFLFDALVWSLYSENATAHSLMQGTNFKWRLISSIEVSGWLSKYVSTYTVSH